MKNVEGFEGVKFTMPKNAKSIFVKTVLIIDVLVVLSFVLLNKFLLYIPYSWEFLFPIASIFVVVNAFLLLPIWLSVKTGMILSVIILLLALALPIYSSSIFQHEKLRALAGEITDAKFEKDLQLVDLNKLPIIHGDLAKNLGEKKLGEIPSLGSQVVAGHFTLQQIKGELYYVAPLEHSGFFKWFKNRQGTPGYIMVNATKENDAKLVTELDGKKLNMKYLESAYFGSEVNRYVFSKENKKGIKNYSFELDDSGRPYWVVSLYEKDVVLNGDKIVGTLIIDVQTGESNKYSVEDTPEWVDRIQPKSTVTTHLQDYGMLVHGVFNFSNKDKVSLTEGMQVIYNGSECFYYTGVTSVSADESLIGFYLTNTRTGETTMYKVSGAIEAAGINSAEGKVQQFGYRGTYPVLINLQRQPTYFITLLDKKGLIKSYAFVNVENYNTVGVGETLQQAYDDYVEILSRDSGLNFSTSTEETELEGVIDRIGLVMKNNNTIYLFTLEGNPTTFIGTTEKNQNIALARAGDKIRVSYIGDLVDSITIQTFENLTLKQQNVSGESIPEQESLTDNKEVEADVDVENEASADAAAEAVTPEHAEEKTENR